MSTDHAEDKFDPKILTKEKSLWELFIIYRRIPVTNFTIFSVLSAVCVSYLYCCLIYPKTDFLIENIRTISDYIFSYATSILGFLIAGFTIFISVNNRDLFVNMASIQNSPAKTNYLKYVFGIFIDVFIVFIALTFFCFLIKALGQKNGIVDVLFDLYAVSTFSKFFFLSAVYIFLITWCVYVFVVLQYFIFNMYKIIMMSIRWDYERLEEED